MGVGDRANLTPFFPGQLSLCVTSIARDIYISLLFQIHNFNVGVACPAGLVTTSEQSHQSLTPCYLEQSCSTRVSFFSFADQDVNFDAILGELYELESQLNSAQTELSRSLGTGGHHPPPPAAFQDGESHESSETRHSSEQVGYRLKSYMFPIRCYPLVPLPCVAGDQAFSKDLASIIMYQHTRVCLSTLIRKTFQWHFSIFSCESFLTKPTIALTAFL